MVIFMKFITPFEKANKSLFARGKVFSKKAQSIFEYVILTAVIVAAVVIFGKNFSDIKKDCSKAFNAAVGEIVK